ncbi:endoplasmic reticulum lectin 1-like [Saccostrea echinata]|uniref:endoplasmic reticulum lectin 1-like n=1 Tax=Saccostrea echinata TaxID=191078 RepID=UPI002A83BE96|nr:endoplasmic reticulum lectin 1-like [Saccostrea echinata]
MKNSFVYHLWYSAFWTLVTNAFNPFMDHDLHAIDWVGPNDLEKIAPGENVIVMKTKANEKYSCVLPESADAIEEELRKHYDGPSPDALISSLFQQNSCSYRIESYWTYELCHGRYLRQYHEDKELSAKKPKVQEYYLGYFGQYRPSKGQDLAKELEEKLKPQEIKSKRVDDIELPYYEVNMTEGTECDLNKKPRQVRILYICQPDGRGEIYEMKETSTCEYEVLVLTSVLCANPKFKPKNPPVSKIACHAMDGSPVRPTGLDHEFQIHPNAKAYTVQIHPEEEEEEQEEEEEETTPTSQPPKKEPPPPKPVDNTLTSTTDNQVLRDFLSGDHCLQGGTGWWKHEFCFGKYARQFHDDPEGRTVIYLGQWHELKHLEWVSKNPSKMPKDKGKRKSLSLLYTGGDECDITGKRRLAEVRLKCVENAQAPHSVSIYLIEPKTCEYIMGIESPLFCSILDRADEYGIIKDTKV